MLLSFFFASFRSKGRPGRRRTLFAALAVGFAVVSVIVWRSGGDGPLADVPLGGHLPRISDADGYRTSNSCMSCHPDEYASWYGTYHRTMTQIASPDAILAPFHDQILASRGRTYRLDRKGDEFWVTMVDPEWEAGMAARGGVLTEIQDPPIVSRKILMVTGSHRMQTYWIANSDDPDAADRKLRQLPWYYDIEDQRWIPSEDSFLNPPNERRHFEIWNHNCITCHSVAGRLGVDLRTGATNSSVAELGIACEACHGPAQKHVLFHTNPDSTFRQAGLEEDPLIVNPRTLSPEASSQICAQCHSNFTPRDLNDWRQKGYRYRPGEDLNAARQLIRFENHSQEPFSFYKDAYWKDRTNCVGGDEFLGLIESPCYQRGEVSCLSCHSMHRSDPDKQLATGMHTNRACLQCHSSYEDRIEDHTHHKEGSSGSLCYNCHMPHTSYALFSALRSHRIDSPSVQTTIATGRPNACNQCHLNRTLQWTQNHLFVWHGTPKVKLSEDQKTIAASLLWLLRGNALQRVIAAWTMGWTSARSTSDDDWQAPFLAHLLNDPYSAVRFVAYRSLRCLPGFRDFEFDFIAERVTLSRSKQQALAIWRQQPSKQAAANRGALLLDGRGALRRQIIEELMNQRDDTPISIPE